MATLFDEKYDNESGLWTKVETVGTQVVNAGKLEWTDPTGGWDDCARYATTGFVLQAGYQIEWWTTVKTHTDYILGFNTAASVALATTKGCYFNNNEDIDFFIGYQVTATDVKWSDGDELHLTGIVQDGTGYVNYFIDGGPYSNLDMGNCEFDHRQLMYISQTSSDTGTGGPIIYIDRVLLTTDGIEGPLGAFESMGGDLRRRDF